jgi:hypothetical protein
MWAEDGQWGSEQKEGDGSIPTQRRGVHIDSNTKLLFEKVLLGMRQEHAGTLTMTIHLQLGDLEQLQTFLQTFYLRQNFRLFV